MMRDTDGECRANYGMWEVVSQSVVVLCPRLWLILVSHRSARLWHEGRACSDVAHADCPFGHHSLKLPTTVKEFGKADEAARDP